MIGARVAVRWWKKYCVARLWVRALAFVVCRSACTIMTSYRWHPITFSIIIMVIMRCTRSKRRCFIKCHTIMFIWNGMAAEKTKKPNNGNVIFHSCREHFLFLFCFISFFASHYFACTHAFRGMFGIDHVLAQRSTMLKEYHSCQFIFNTYIISAAVDSDAVTAGKNFWQSQQPRREWKMKIKNLQWARAGAWWCWVAVLLCVGGGVMGIWHWYRLKRQLIISLNSSKLRTSFTSEFMK